MYYDKHHDTYIMQTDEVKNKRETLQQQLVETLNTLKPSGTGFHYVALLDQDEKLGYESTVCAVLQQGNGRFSIDFDCEVTDHKTPEEAAEAMINRLSEYKEKELPDLGSALSDLEAQSKAEGLSM